MKAFSRESCSRRFSSANHGSIQSYNCGTNLKQQSKPKIANLAQSPRKHLKKQVLKRAKDHAISPHLISLQHSFNSQCPPQSSCPSKLNDSRPKQHGHVPHMSRRSNSSSQPLFTILFTKKKTQTKPCCSSLDLSGSIPTLHTTTPKTL
jgi:hypothetical protein